MNREKIENLRDILVGFWEGNCAGTPCVQCNDFDNCEIPQSVKSLTLKIEAMNEE